MAVSPRSADVSPTFDLVVIGAGSGGLAAAKRAARHGAKVALVEGDRVGGTCVVRGCVPKKLLVYGAQARDQLQDAAAYGLQVDGVTSDVGVLLERVRQEVDRLNALHLDFLERAGVQLIRGWGRLTGSHAVGVSDIRGGDLVQELSAQRILIAVGGRPNRLAIPGNDLAWLSDDMFLQETYPSSVVVVGAGFIACEFACILRGLGVEVTQVVRGPRLLRGFDAELADAVLDGMRESGIAVRFEQQVAAIEGEPGQLTAVLDGGDRVACGGVLLATGRHPWLDDLGLDTAGVQLQHGRIVVDDNQVTSVPEIYAVGDVTDRVNLTPVAIDEGRALADRLFAGLDRRVDHELVAMAVFSSPELASIGLSEDQAIERQGKEAIEIHRARFRSMDRALPGSGPRCLLKLVIDRASQRVLGCHMVGAHAAEIIQMAAVAVSMGATKADFDRTMALHPTVAEEFVTMQ